MGVRRYKGDTCIFGNRTSELQSNSTETLFSPVCGADWRQPPKDSHPGISRGQAARPLASHRTCTRNGRLRQLVLLRAQVKNEEEPVVLLLRVKQRLCPRMAMGTRIHTAVARHARGVYLTDRPSAGQLDIRPTS